MTDRTNFDAMVETIRYLSLAEMLAVQFDVFMANRPALYHNELGVVIIACVNRPLVPLNGAAGVPDLVADRAIATCPITTDGLAAVTAQVALLPTRTGRWGWGEHHATWPPTANWPSTNLTPAPIHQFEPGGQRPSHPPHGPHQHIDEPAFGDRPAYNCF